MKKTKKNNGSKNYKALFFIWLFTFIFMSIGFSGHTSTLAFEGMATIQKHIYDYVYVTHAEVSDYSGGVSNNFSFLDHEIRTDVSLPSCNNYVTYRLSIVNSTPYKAFITQAGLDSAFNGNGAATSSFSVEFLDTNGNPIVINNTFIPRYSSMDIDVKVKNNCTGSDTSGVVTSNFEYSLYKYFDLTVNSVSPSDGEITLTTPEGTYTGNSSVTHRVMEGQTATYKVKKKYYYDANGSYTMTADDHIENISLIPDPHRDLTINASPSSSTIVVNQDGSVICSGTGSLVCSVESGKNVTFTVDEPEYYYSESGGVYSGYSETFSMPATETTKSVTLTERPWITGSLPNTNRGTARTLTSTNWHSGYYLVEVWGGEGGVGDDSSSSCVPGESGYIYGVIYIPYDTQIFRTSGGNGDRDTGVAEGGANGGGTGGSSSSSGLSGHRGAGGGYSAFVMGATSVNQTNINNGKVKFIAAGGGGSSARGQNLSTQRGGSGGNGATLSSASSSISAGVVFSGSDGEAPAGSAYGRGGSTSGGAKGGNSATAGSLLQGGNADTRGGGGGAGYYGGGGGSVNNRITNGGPGGGGGGSSFIASGITYSGLSSSITNKLTPSNPSTTGGCVKVQWIGKTM